MELAQAILGLVKGLSTIWKQFWFFCFYVLEDLCKLTGHRNLCRLGYLHRDVSSENCMLDKEETGFSSITTYQYQPPPRIMKQIDYTDPLVLSPLSCLTTGADSAKVHREPAPSLLARSFNQPQFVSRTRSGMILNH